MFSSMTHAEQAQPALQTIARFRKDLVCQGVAAADRYGNVFVEVAHGHDMPYQMLQVQAGSNKLVQLPLRLDEEHSGISVSPSGQELYEGTFDGRLLVHRAPWADRPGEMLLDGQIDVRLMLSSSSWCASAAD